MTTEQTLDDAIDVFRRHGFVGASISMLVEATGRSRSSLYREFDDKDGLFFAAVLRYVNDHYTHAGIDTDVDNDLPCLLTRSCNELTALPSNAANLIHETLEKQWVAFIGDGNAPDAEAKGTLALAVRHGLATLASAGVPPDVLRDAADLL